MTETEDERGSDVDEVTKVASMSGGYVRRQPPQGEHGRRRPWGVAAMPKGAEERDEACQRDRDLLCMMELSDIHHERQREYYTRGRDCSRRSGRLDRGAICTRAIFANV